MPNHWLHVARQTLAIYFLVEGLLFLPNVLGAFGTPGLGSREWILALIPFSQAAVAIGSALVLLRRTRAVELTGAGDVAFAMPFILQLVGVYFVVQGLTRLVVLGPDLWLFWTSWQVRLSDVLAAAVALGAGLVLVAKPARIVAVLVSVSRSA
jgi:hypothetical protein